MLGTCKQDEREFQRGWKEGGIKETTMHQGNRILMKTGPKNVTSYSHQYTALTVQFESEEARGRW